MKLFSIILSIVMATGLAYIAGQHSGKMNGLLQGCQKLADLAIPELSPECSFVDNTLAVHITNPDDESQTATIDVNTGAQLE